MLALDLKKLVSADWSEEVGEERIDGVARQFLDNTREIGGRDVELVGIELNLSLALEVACCQMKKEFKDSVLMALDVSIDINASHQFCHIQLHALCLKVYQFLFVEVVVLLIFRSKSCISLNIFSLKWNMG